MKEKAIEENQGLDNCFNVSSPNFTFIISSPVLLQKEITMSAYVGWVLCMF